MSVWWSDRACIGRDGRPLFADIDAVFSLVGEVVARDSMSSVQRVEIDGKRYYVKRYLGNGKNPRTRWYGLRQWLSPPRVKSEWENLQAFARWGIPTAGLVAYGLERRFGGFRRGALVTEEIAGASDLARLATSEAACLRDREWVSSVRRQVAAMTRLMHRARFVHNDLKWRNVLVTGERSPQAYLIDCPSGGFWRGPFLHYRIVKDLACLDKVAKLHLSRTERLRFYLDYVGRKTLSADDKRRVRKISRFFVGRE